MKVQIRPRGPSSVKLRFVPGIQGLKGEQGPPGTRFVYASRAEVAADHIPPFASMIWVDGARFNRIASGSALPWQIQSADGTWWELNETKVTPEMVGAVIDGTTDNTQSVRDVVAYFKSRGRPGGNLHFLNKTYRVAHAGLDQPQLLVTMEPGGELFMFTHTTVAGVLLPYNTGPSSDGSGITIRGVKFTSDWSFPRQSGNGIYSQNVDQLTIEDCIFENFPGNAIWVGAGCVGAKVRRNHINGCKMGGIQLSDDVDGFEVADNTILNVGDDAIGLIHDLPVTAPFGPRDGIVTGNRIRGTTWGCGVALVGASNIVIEGNNIGFCAGPGIGLYYWEAEGTAAPASRDITIGPNQIRQCGRAGSGDAGVDPEGFFDPSMQWYIAAISVAYAQAVTISDQDIADMWLPDTPAGDGSAYFIGHAVENITILGGTVSDCTRGVMGPHPDSLQTPKTSVTDLEIRGVSFDTIMHEAIYIGASDVPISGLVIADNTLSACGTSSGRSIYVARTAGNVTIIDNNKLLRGSTPILWDLATAYAVRSDVWAAFGPGFTAAASGTYTLADQGGRFRVVRGRVEIEGYVKIADKGTGWGLRMGVPIPIGGGLAASGREETATGYLMQGVKTAGVSTSIDFLTYNNVDPIPAGASDVTVTASYPLD